MMNKNIQKLNKIVEKDEKLIIGLMSGTSLDGLDIALCKIKGYGINTKVKLVDFETISYPDEFRDEIKKICFKNHVDLNKVCLLNTYIGKKHGDYINEFLGNRNIDAEDINLIASHGQTIYHSPARLRSADKFGNGTLQIGDADQIAVKTKIITLSDFRQKNIAQGFEGAPLAIYGDYLLFNNAEENRILLNIGGIANFTILPAKSTFKELLSTDVGPGNTIMDQFVQQHFEHMHFDKDAEIATKGKVSEILLNALMQDTFFENSFPKTTGPELFNLFYLKMVQKNSGSLDLSNEDIMATLNRFTALCITEGIKACQDFEGKTSVYLSGGGIHNPLLIKNLKELLPRFEFKNIQELGINPDAKEAVLFAVLANETICGNSSDFSESTLSMGKISFPY